MAAAKKLECVHCGRAFRMPAHLGRHMNAVHGAGKPSTGGRKPGRPAGRSLRAALDGFNAITEQVQRARESLLEQRARIDSQIEKISQILQALS